MNKIVIPSLVAATILLAGIFAVMPIEKATAVHTTILANTIELKTVRCLQEENMVDANEGTYTLNLPAASTNALLMDIQLEGGAQPLDANDVLTITTMVVDAVDISADNAATIADSVFDAAPEEGSIVEMTQLNSGIGINDNLAITIAVEATTNTSDYTITFWYLAPGNDADALCDVALL